METGNQPSDLFESRIKSCWSSGSSLPRPPAATSSRWGQEGPGKRSWYFRGLLAALGMAFVLALAGSPSMAIGKEMASDRAPSFAGTRDYIVLFKTSVELDSALGREKRMGNRVEERFDSSINGGLVQLEAEDVSRLRDDGRVLAIEPDRRVSIRAGSTASRAAGSWGLDRIDERELRLDGKIATPNLGSGVEAYIIDTGIRLDHSEFKGRINSESFSAYPSGPNDCEGHGTHVAGTVAGSTWGVAPQARLTAVRVLDCNGSGLLSDIIKGIDWMITDHRAGEPAVANMSLGGSYSATENAAVQRAIDDGITMVVAAGNEATSACNRSPASAPNAITVGATDEWDTEAYFSNSGPCVDLYAPGVYIRSASNLSSTAWEELSGT